jgi:hypothetical protein
MNDKNAIETTDTTMTDKTEGEVREALTILHRHFATFPGKSLVLPTVPDMSEQETRYLLERTFTAISRKNAARFAYLMREVPVKWANVVQSHQVAAAELCRAIDEQSNPMVRAMLADKRPTCVKVSFADLRGVFPPGATGDNILQWLKDAGLSLSQTKGAKKGDTSTMYVELPLAPPPAVKDDMSGTEVDLEQNAAE